MSSARSMVPLILSLLAVACAAGDSSPSPAALDTRHDACASCRMPVSDARLAAQLVAPGEEPVFFDDIGCLRDYVSGHPEAASRAMAWVSDHRTSVWTAAADARFSRCPALETPMGSHLVAHASAASRDADSTIRSGGCATVTATEVFGPNGPPRGRSGR